MSNQEKESPSHISSTEYKGVEADWASHVLTALIGQVHKTPKFADHGVPYAWTLENEAGAVMLLPNPVSMHLELIVVEMSIRETTPDGYEILQNLRLVGSTQMILFVQSKVKEALLATDGKSIEEATENELLAEGWFRNWMGIGEELL
jgi:hypothetical protein